MKNLWSKFTLLPLQVRISIIFLTTVLTFITVVSPWFMLGAFVLVGFIWSGAIVCAYFSK